MSKPFKPWFKFQKGSKKSKESSPLSTVEPSNEKLETDSKNHDIKNNKNSAKNDQLKQSSISKFFSSPARGSKRPLADEDAETVDQRPPKRINDNAENSRKTKEQLAKFQFDSAEAKDGVSGGQMDSESVTGGTGGRAPEGNNDFDNTITNELSHSSDKAVKGDGGTASSNGEKKSISISDDKKSKPAGSWFPAAKSKSEAKDSPKGKSVPSNGAKAKYTPLEQQFVDLKKQYPDAILLIECGYKFRYGAIMMLVLIRTFEQTKTRLAKKC